ncbi:MauE/DoxX family redox-associated membrane protein [Nonomuraea sp. NPDC050556]|uniref:MauE/DoxX family redox-associated membrane protein n=1 Tax=Nonomuraea sp. NPDC050556 TaxID=3364369 RepID=UPI0037A5478C
MFMDYAALAFRCFIGLLFLLSALSKLRSRAAFLEFTVSTRQLLATPRIPTGIAAGTAAGAELAVPVLLAVPVSVRLGFSVACLLLAAFTVAIVAALRRKVSASCRCFGASSAPLGRAHVVRNTLLFLVSALGLALGTGAPIEPAGWVITAAAAAVAAVLVARLDDLLALFAPVR